MEKLKHVMVIYGGIKMIETRGLGAGSYPDPPNEVIDDDDYDLGWDLADEYHDLMMIGEIE